MYDKFEPSEYALKGTNITVCKRLKDMWAIKLGNAIYTKEDLWENEPPIEIMSDEFVKRAYYKSLEDTMTRVIELKNKTDEIFGRNKLHAI